MAERMERGGRPTEAEIRRMVEIFYARVREDGELGPIFERRIGSDWDPHLERMTDFWSTVLLASGRYRGNPLQTHSAIRELRPEHFDRWLALFLPVLEDIFDEHMAKNIFARAQRMRVVLERGVKETNRQPTSSGTP